VFVFRFAIRHFVQLRVHGSRQDLKQRMLSETQESQSGNELEHVRTILGDFFSWLMSLILRSAEPCVLTPSSTFLLMCAMVYCAWTPYAESQPPYVWSKYPPAQCASAHV
jgi:hypothetical protein